MSSTERLRSIAVICCDTSPLPRLHFLFLPLPLPQAMGPSLQITHSCQRSWQPLDPFFCCCFFTHNGTSGGSTGLWQQKSAQPVREKGWEGSTESGSLSRRMKQLGATICETCQMRTLQRLRAAATIPIRKQ